MGSINSFVAIRYGAAMIRDREERMRFARLIQDGAPLDAFSDWPDFQEIAKETPTWESSRR